MNQTFSFRRWWMLVTLHWVENRRRYLLGLLAIAGLLVAWFSFLLAIDKFSALDTFFQFSAYMVGLFIIGCLMAGSGFSELGNKQQGIGYLAVPASHLEKLLVVLFFTILLFFIGYTLVFYLVDIPFVNASNRLFLEKPILWPGTTHLVYKTSLYNIFTGSGAPVPEQEDHSFLVGYFAIQSAYILGSIYFSRSSFIKTTIAVLLFMLVFVVFIEEGVQRHLPGGWRINDLFGWTRTSSLLGQRQWVRLPFGIDHLLLFVLRFGIPPLFWVITYFRLREKEV